MSQRISKQILLKWDALQLVPAVVPQFCLFEQDVFLVPMTDPHNTPITLLKVILQVMFLTFAFCVLSLYPQLPRTTKPSHRNISTATTPTAARTASTTPSDHVSAGAPKRHPRRDTDPSLRSRNSNRTPGRAFSPSTLHNSSFMDPSQLYLLYECLMFDAFVWTSLILRS